MTITKELTTQDLERLALDAYLYFYPLVIMETTRRHATSGTMNNNELGTPMGMLLHAKEFPSAQFRTIVRPNFDTLYSTAWLNVSNEPYLFEIPEMGDRFFMFPIYDMWTDIIASPGTFTDGQGPYRYAICSPKWQGVLPDGFERINVTTDTVWIIGRVETRNVVDYPNVHALQKQMKLAPLSSWPEARADAAEASFDTSVPPMLKVDQFSSREFFLLASQLIAKYPAHATDWGILARLKRIGFEVGTEFDLDAATPEIQVAFENVVLRVLSTMMKRGATYSSLANGWTTWLDLGVYGNAYLKRAMIARLGLGANPQEESIYPTLQRDSANEKLDGTKRYVLRFEADQLPPVDAFWSLTIYDRNGYHRTNELDRFALGDRDELTFGEDGSLELYLQHERPSDANVSNWLPLPAEQFIACARLYLPKQEALMQTWSMPPVHCLD